MPGMQVLMVLLAALLAISPASACSFFMIHDGKRVLAGNNEDSWNPDTWIWYVPAEETKHGCVYFGYRDRFPQGGMNDQGLFYDGAATEELLAKNTKGKKKLPLAELLRSVMEQCANVDEVIAFLSRHDLSVFARAQMLYADPMGDSVLVEGDEMIRGSGNYQITTNFYQSQVKNGRILCERYKTIDRMLEAADEASVDLVRNTLAAVRQEGSVSTQYSNICDLVNLRIYLYHFHNFEEVVTIDLREELAKGKHDSEIRELFHESFAARTYRLQWEGKPGSESAPPMIAITLIGGITFTIAVVIGSIVGVSVAVRKGWLRTARVWKGILGGTFGALVGGAGASLVATLIPAVTGWPKDFFSWGAGPTPALVVVPPLAVVFAVIGAVIGAVARGRPLDERLSG